MGTFLGAVHAVNRQRSLAINNQQAHIPTVLPRRGTKTLSRGQTLDIALSAIRKRCFFVFLQVHTPEKLNNFNFFCGQLVEYKCVL